MKKTFWVFFSLLFLVSMTVFVTAQASQRAENTPVPIAHRGEQVTVPADIQAKINKMREEINAKGYTFHVGYNPAMRYTLGELCSFKVPKHKVITNDTYPIQTLTNLPSSFDWRNNGGTTPIKDQGSCGGCWAFSTCATTECIIKIKDGTTVDLSEQYLISCNNEGWGCNGGYFAFDYFVNPGAVLESCMPYTASDSSCNSSCSHPYKIDSWAYIAGQYSIPTVDQIKSAIYQYGPISAAVYVDSYFQAYTGGVFNHNASGSPNHAINLVGWDDSKGAWILRNSWGTGWGESGYMYIAYNTNSVGYGACYAVYSGSGGGGGGGDSYEPNDSASQAYGPVSSGQNYSGAEISTSSDVDWFYFNLNYTGTINVSVSIDSSGADLDCYLYKASDTSNWVARGYTTNNPETCSYDATTTGKYYVKVVGYNGSTSGYTLKVTYPTSAPAPPPGDENMALNKPATASSYYSSTYAPSKAVDGNTGTAWASDYLPWYGTTQWIYVNLGSNKSISKVKIKWSTSNYPTTYYIQRWSGSSWVNVAQVNGDGSWDTINFSSPFTAQYVRVYCTARHSSYYLIYELEIY